MTKLSHRDVFPFIVLLQSNAACADSSSPDAGKATETCQASCEHQGDFCDTLELDGCFDLCTCVISTIADSETCLELASDLWLGGQEDTWSCSEETAIVGELDNPQLCSQAKEAFKAAGCERPCGDGTSTQ